jgi:hypothetical protein
MSELSVERAQPDAADLLQRRSDLDNLRSALNQWSRAALIETLIDYAAQDDVLCHRLQSAAWRSSPPESEASRRALVRRVFAVPRGYVDRQEMPTFVARAQAAAELLQGLLDQGDAGQALVLADEALQFGMAAYEYTDDSAGAFGDLLRRLATIHLQACRSTPVDPSGLAASLLRLQLDDDWGLFRLANYAPLLGALGLARYRALAEAAWLELPERVPGDRPMHGGRFFVLARIMEDLARLAGDIEALAAVKARDLSTVHAFVEIAKLYADANRHGEALAWAERGRAAFPCKADPTLTEFLIHAYHRAQRHEDATALAWEYFVAMPSRRGYRLLRSVCQSGAWPAWREKAFAQVRALVAGQRAHDRSDSCEGDLLIEMLIDEGRVDAALAEAKQSGCSPAAWLDIAAACEAEHPEEAIVIYRNQIEITLQRTGNRVYDEAVARVRKIGELFARIDRPGEFRRWLVELKGRYRARRNLVRRLEEVSS